MKRHLDKIRMFQQPVQAARKKKRRPPATAALENQDTLIVPIASKLALPQTPILNFVRRIITILLIRVKEPDPERWSHTMAQRAIKHQDQPLGWFSILAVINASGVLLVAYGCVTSMHTATNQEMYLWLGLFLIFAPAFLRLLSAIASKFERVAILCSVGICVYLLPELLSPLNFFFVDEYMHLRTVDDIMQTSHLFSKNSMLPISPPYPGLEIVTSALSSLSGLNTFLAGLIVIGIARIVVMLSLFMLFEQITRSPRLAALATIIYTANSGFFMFDSLFVYESIGLAIGIFLLFTLCRSQNTEKGKTSLLIFTCIAIAALTASHHVSDFFFIAILALWTIVQRFSGKNILRSNITQATIVGLLLTGFWIFFVAHPVIGYLSAPLTSSLTQLQNVLTGSNHARHLFVDHTNGHPTPLWEQLTMATSIGLVTLGIPFAFLCLWHRYHYKPLPFTLALISLLYPFTQALRVASESANIPDRSSPYIFIAVSFALATLITQMWPVQKLKWKQATVITGTMTLIFLGGSLLGSGPSWRLMPSGYLIGDDARSVDLESVQAALWMPVHQGLNNRIFTNSTNALLMGSYGDQHSISLAADGVDVAPVLYAPEFHSWETSILQRARVRYLAVDMRMSLSLPAKGYYFEGEEEPDLNVMTPIIRQALTKFNTAPMTNRIFDSGNIVIYDVGGLTDASKEP